MDDRDEGMAGNTHLITCVVQRGKGDAIVRAAIDGGARGATAFFARGTGTRERLGLLGLAIVPEKEVVFIVCLPEKTDRIFDAIAKAAKLDVPGMGIAYVTPILKITGGNF